MKKYKKGIQASAAIMAAFLMIGTAFAKESAMTGQEIVKQKSEMLTQEEQMQEGHSQEGHSQVEIMNSSPEGSNPEGSDPEESNPEGSDPEESNPEGSDPENSDKEGGDSEGPDQEGLDKDGEKLEPTGEDDDRDSLLSEETDGENTDGNESGNVKDEAEPDTDPITDEVSSEEVPPAEDIEEPSEGTEESQTENTTTADKTPILDNKTESDTGSKSEEIFTDGNTVVSEPIFQMDQVGNIEQFKDLRLSSTQIKELIRLTGGKMGEERLQVVLHAYSLVGKVHYFWGGKSETIGWDERWGVPAVVTSEGSSASGTTCTYGLDCSGFVTWAFLNAAGDDEIVSNIGHGTSAQWANTEEIEEEDALPGDLAFMAPGNSSDNHVGIVVGRNQEGQLMFAHCSGGYDNVVVTTASEGSLRYLRRPLLYTDESIGFSEMVEKNPKAMTESNKELFEEYVDLNLMKNEE